MSKETENVPESQQEERVAEYLDLVETYGVRHPKVTAFLEQHRQDPEIQEWSKVVEEVSTKRRSSNRILPQVLRGVSVATLPLLILVAVYGAIGFTQTKDALAETRAERDRAVNESQELASTVESKDNELRFYANAKEEITKMRMQVAQADKARNDAESALTKVEQKAKELIIEAARTIMDRDKIRSELIDAKSALTKEKQQAERLKSDVATLTKDRDDLKKVLAGAQTSIESLKADYEKRLRLNPYRTAVLITACSRLAALDVPRESPALKKLLAPQAEAPAGDHYGWAILYGNNGDQKQYRTELDQVLKDKNDPWYRLAAAESDADLGDFAPMVQWLGGLEERVQSDFDTLMSTSFLLAQKEVSKQAIVRLFKGSNHKRKQAILDALTDAVKNERVNTRLASVAALGAIGPDAKAAVSMLVSVLEKDSSVQVRWAAVRALGAIGPAAEKAVSALRDVSKNEKDPSIRIQAARALTRIETKTE